MALRKRWRLRLRAQPEPAHFAYSRWDGSQAGFDFDADHIFDELADDLLYHGDLASALRRLMAEGFRDRSGRQLEGLRSAEGEQEAVEDEELSMTDALQDQAQQRP